MKKWVLAVLLCAGVVSAQKVDEFLAKVLVRVTDDAGMPVSQARVLLSTYNAWVPARQGVGRGEYGTELGVTDTNGCVALSLKSSSGRYNCMALPLPGFHFDRGLETVFTNSAAGRWEPWASQVNLVLKRSEPPPAREDDFAPVAIQPVNPGSRPGNVSKDPAIGFRPGQAPRDARQQ